MVKLSAYSFKPTLLRGIQIDPKNAFQLDFIVTPGDDHLNTEQFKTETTRMVKYFLASLTTPDKDLWVNLSPFEKNRIVPKEFGKTEMGRDMLAEDYVLKQVSSSLIYPEDASGKEFWAKVYQEVARRTGSANIPMNAFNKVWVVPSDVLIYENGKGALINSGSLKVMLEEDLIAAGRLSKNQASNVEVSPAVKDALRQVIIPLIEKEVNEGKNFATLRQVFYSLALATWYKKRLKESILGQVYMNKDKVAGVNFQDAQNKEKIYQQYLKAFKKGVFNYIKEDKDPLTNEVVPRKYFSGGNVFQHIAEVTTTSRNLQDVPRDLDKSMTAKFVFNFAKSALAGVVALAAAHTARAQQVTAKDYLRSNPFDGGKSVIISVNGTKYGLSEITQNGVVQDNVVDSQGNVQGNFSIVEGINFQGTAGPLYQGSRSLINMSLSNPHGQSLDIVVTVSFTDQNAGLEYPQVERVVVKQAGFNVPDAVTHNMATANWLAGNDDLVSVLKTSNPTNNTTFASLGTINSVVVLGASVTDLKNPDAQNISVSFGGSLGLPSSEQLNLIPSNQANYDYFANLSIDPVSEMFDWIGAFSSGGGYAFSPFVSSDISLNQAIPGIITIKNIGGLDVANGSFYSAIEAETTNGQSFHLFFINNLNPPHPDYTAQMASYIANLEANGTGINITVSEGLMTDLELGPFTTADKNTLTQAGIMTSGNVIDYNKYTAQKNTISISTYASNAIEMHHSGIVFAKTSMLPTLFRLAHKGPPQGANPQVFAGALTGLSTSLQGVISPRDLVGLFASGLYRNNFFSPALTKPGMMTFFGNTFNNVVNDPAFKAGVTQAYPYLKGTISSLAPADYQMVMSFLNAGTLGTTTSSPKSSTPGTRNPDSGMFSRFKSAALRKILPAATAVGIGLGAAHTASAQQNYPSNGRLNAIGIFHKGAVPFQLNTPQGVLDFSPSSSAQVGYVTDSTGAVKGNYLYDNSFGDSITVTIGNDTTSFSIDPTVFPVKTTYTIHTDGTSWQSWGKSAILLEYIMGNAPKSPKDFISFINQNFASNSLNNPLNAPSFLSYANPMGTLFATMPTNTPNQMSLSVKAEGLKNVSTNYSLSIPQFNVPYTSIEDLTTEVLGQPLQSASYLTFLLPGAGSVTNIFAANLIDATGTPLSNGLKVYGLMAPNSPQMPLLVATLTDTNSPLYLSGQSLQFVENVLVGLSTGNVTQVMQSLDGISTAKDELSGSGLSPTLVAELEADAQKIFNFNSYMTVEAGNKGFSVFGSSLYPKSANITSSDLNIVWNQLGNVRPNFPGLIGRLEGFSNALHGWETVHPNASSPEIAAVTSIENAVETKAGAVLNTGTAWSDGEIQSFLNLYLGFPNLTVTQATDIYNFISYQFGNNTIYDPFTTIKAVEVLDEISTPLSGSALIPQIQGLEQQLKLNLPPEMRPESVKPNTPGATHQAMSIPSTNIYPKTTTLSPTNIKQEDVGGINFDPAQINMQVKFDGEGFRMDPVTLAKFKGLKIDGLSPIMIGVLPFNITGFLTRTAGK